MGTSSRGPQNPKQRIFDLLTAAPGSIDPLDLSFQLAEAHLAAGDAATAKDLLLKKVLTPHGRPSHVPSLLLAAEVCAQRQEWLKEGKGFAEKALQLLEGGSSSDRGFAGGDGEGGGEDGAAAAAAEGKNLKGEGLFLLGVILLLLSRTEYEGEERHRCLESSEAALKKAIDSGMDVETIKFDLALLYAEQRAYPKALKHAKGLLAAALGAEAASPHVDVWRLNSLLVCAAKGIEEGVKMCQAGVLYFQGAEDSESCAKMMKLKAAILMGSSQAKEAVVVYRDLLAMQKKKHVGVSEQELWFLLMEAYLVSSQPLDAEACIHRLKTTAPYSPWTFLAVGRSAEVTRNFELALVAYESGVAAHPSNQTIRARRAICLSSMGPSYCQRARDELKQALAFDSSDLELQQALGVLEKKSGRLDESKVFLNAVVGLSIGAPPVSYATICPSVCRRRS